MKEIKRFRSSLLSHLPSLPGSSVLTDGGKREEILLKPAQLLSNPPPDSPPWTWHLLRGQAARRRRRRADDRAWKEDGEGRTHAWKSSRIDVGSLALATRPRRISKQRLFASRLTANG